MRNTAPDDCPLDVDGYRRGQGSRKFPSQRSGRHAVACYWGVLVGLVVQGQLDADGQLCGNRDDGRRISQPPRHSGPHTGDPAEHADLSRLFALYQPYVASLPASRDSSRAGSAELAIGIRLTLHDQADQYTPVTRPRHVYPNAAMEIFVNLALGGTHRRPADSRLGLHSASGNQNDTGG